MPSATRDHAFEFCYYGELEQEPRHWLGALLTSSVLYVVVGVLAAAIGVGTRRIVTERPVEIKFVEKITRLEPPPAPPKPVVEPAAPLPKVATEAKRPPAAAPIVPKDMKIRKLDAPPPPKTLTAPTEMPLDEPAEADASLDRGIAVYGEPGEGDAAGLEGGVAGGIAGGVFGALPAGAMAPQPSRGNAYPRYPQEARNAGRAGDVRLKVIITADGHVDDVHLVEGEEPFVAAALTAVKKWRYQPAEYKGQAIAVRRVIEVHFKLRA
jgi:protein TonB